MLILKSGIRNEKGFTLLEFVVVLLILGFVFGLALPRLYRNVDKDPLRLSANLLAEAIRRLRHHSISEGELFRLRVTLPDGRWVAEGLDGNGKWLKLAKSPVESSSILEGVRLRDVRIGKRANSVRGVVYLRFFPSGEAEEASLYLIDDDLKERTLSVHPFYNSVEIHHGRIRKSHS